MDDKIDPTDFKDLMETALNEQLRTAMELALSALDEYAIENADLDTALVALRCRTMLAAPKTDQERAE